MDMKTQRIAYIGRKAVKKDNIAGTGIMWDGFGDIQEVPHGAAVKMLNHPDVWIAEKQYNERFPENVVDEDAGASDTQNSDSGLSQVQTATPVQTTAVQEPAPAQTTTAPAAPAPASEPGKVVAEGQSEQSRLFAIFGQLTEEDVSKHGPKIAKVRELLGREISVEEVKEAWGIYKQPPATAQ